MTENEAINKWREAKTLGDMGELTAQWIEGKLPFSPLYGDSPDEETFEIQEPLKFLNRSGFLTVFSQPAESLDETGFAQRACLEGFTNFETALKLETLTLSTSLLVHMFYSDNNEGYRVPVTIDEFQSFTWAGDRTKKYHIDIFANSVSNEAIEVIENSYQVVVIDLEWGRKEYLWKEVTKIFTNKEDKRFKIIFEEE